LIHFYKRVCEKTEVLNDPPRKQRTMSRAGVRKIGLGLVRMAGVGET
jgi:hypothetical protein